MCGLQVLVILIVVYAFSINSLGQGVMELTFLTSKFSNLSNHVNIYQNHGQDQLQMGYLCNVISLKLPEQSVSKCIVLLFSVQINTNPDLNGRRNRLLLVAFLLILADYATVEQKLVKFKFYNCYYCRDASIKLFLR